MSDIYCFWMFVSLPPIDEHLQSKSRDAPPSVPGFFCHDHAHTPLHAAGMHGSLGVPPLVAEPPSRYPNTPTDAYVGIELDVNHEHAIRAGRHWTSLCIR